jgi:hypothetical protein
MDMGMGWSIPVFSGLWIWVWVGLPGFSGFMDTGMGWLPSFFGFYGYGPYRMGMGWIPENPTKSNTHKKIGYFYLVSCIFAPFFSIKHVHLNLTRLCFLLNIIISVVNIVNINLQT